MKPLSLQPSANPDRNDSAQSKRKDAGLHGIKNDIHSRATDILNGVPFDTMQSIAALQKNTDPSVSSSFELKGQSEDGTQRKTTFEISFNRRDRFDPADVCDIKISSPEDPEMELKATLFANTHEASIENVTMGSLEGYGFYTQLMNALLKGINRTSNPITNNEVGEVVRQHRKSGREKMPSALPHSILAAETPLAASRKGFITFLERSGTELNAVRVSDDLVDLLEIAVAREKISHDKPALAEFERIHPNARPQELADAMAKEEDGLPADALDALENQVAYLREQTAL